jgi:hypothetical protein
LGLESNDQCCLCVLQQKSERVLLDTWQKSKILKKQDTMFPLTIFIKRKGYHWVWKTIWVLKSVYRLARREYSRCYHKNCKSTAVEVAKIHKKQDMTFPLTDFIQRKGYHWVRYAILTLKSVYKLARREYSRCYHKNCKSTAVEVAKICKKHDTTFPLTIFGQEKGYH